MVMVLESPAAVPAAPPRAGVVLFVNVPLTGAVKVTAGGVVSMVNVLGALVPTMPALFACCATAVYVPCASAGEATDQAPPLAVAVSVSTTLPPVVAPA